MKTSRSRTKLAESYLSAKETVIEDGYAAEIDWQDEVQFAQVTEHRFLREAGWVVLSSGMRETVVRLKFPAISVAFCSWQSAHQIVSNSKRCRKRALTVFCHQQKIGAIIGIAERIYARGFKHFKDRIGNEGVEFVRTLPFMGPATSYHLAKNIGLDVVKPDRHLLRVASAAGYKSPRSLCEDEDIAAFVGDRVSVIDLVIWRFATLNPNYVEHFS